MYRNVLIPTDGTDHAERGVEHGLELAEDHDAAVHALYVVDERVHGSTPAVGGQEAFLEKVEEDAEVVVDDVVARARARGLEADGTLLRGRPDEQISEFAEDQGVDVVVMGRRDADRSGPSRPSSITDRVARNADVEVVWV